MNFSFYTNNKNLVVAETVSNGKQYKGVARCAPDDDFELEFGKKLAAARCELKIHKDRAKEHLTEANARQETARFFRREADRQMDLFEREQNKVEELERKIQIFYHEDELLFS